MLQFAKSFINRPIYSLRTNRAVAFTTRPIINPANLKIEGFYCTDSVDKRELILLYQDIRDIMPRGLIINDHDVLAEQKDLVRLRRVFNIDLELIGKKVITIDKQRLGKVTDFAVEVETMYIQKIYVSQGLMRNLTGGNLGIDRNQIHEVTNTKIVVANPLEEASIRVGAPA